MPEETTTQKPMVRLTKKQIKEKQRQIKQYMEAANAATGSLVDSNANVSIKTVTTMGAELQKDYAIQLNRQTLADYIEKEFGTELADEYIDMLERHVLYKHDEASIAPGQPYCVAISMYPFLLDGMVKLGGESKAPKHLESFCGSFVNLIFAISSQFAGAVAAVEFLLYFHYFAQKDYGADYLETHTELIKQKLQGVTFCLNQPAAARGYQSVFFNISVFDRYYFESMFGHFAFPDGTKVDYDEFNKLQKFFLEWLLEERSKSLLTFPVLTEASLNEDGKPKDAEWADFCADVRSRGLSFFSFNDDNVSALSSCCYDGDEVIQVKHQDGEKFITTIKDFITLNAKSTDDCAIKGDTGYSIDSINPDTLEIEPTKIVGILKRPYSGTMYTFKVNGQSVRVTHDHVFLVKNKETGSIEQLPAEEIAKAPSKYQFGVCPL